MKKPLNKTHYILEVPRIGVLDKQFKSAFNAVEWVRKHKDLHGILICVFQVSESGTHLMCQIKHD